MRTDHLVGRASTCDLCIDEPHVSLLHASLRWSGEHWEVKDLGSRNGTSVDGVLLAPGEARSLEAGAQLCFGHSSSTAVWTLRDASPPAVMVSPLDGAAPLWMEGDVLAIPSPDQPERVVLRGDDGAWQLEDSDGRLTPLDDGSVFQAGGRQWRFTAPRASVRTSTLEGNPSLHSARLEFAVSQDEEHVELRVECAGRVYDLGARTHNYVLLTLARQRIADARLELVDSTRGWTYLEELLRALATTSSQLNVDIYRIRKQFGELGVSNAASIIERRPRTRQLRIGAPYLEVRPL